MLAAKRGSFPLKLPHPPQNPRIIYRQVKMGAFRTHKVIFSPAEETTDNES